MTHRSLAQLHKNNLLNRKEYQAGIKLMQLIKSSQHHIHANRDSPDHHSEKTYKLSQMILNRSNHRQILLDLTQGRITYLSYTEAKSLKKALSELDHFLKKRHI